MELNKEFWLKVKEEYSDRYIKWSYQYELCCNSKSFRNVFSSNPEEIHKMALLFISQTDNIYSVYFRVMPQINSSAALFVRKSLTEPMKCWAVRMRFIDWCILNSK